MNIKCWTSKPKLWNLNLKKCNKLKFELLDFRTQISSHSEYLENIFFGVFGELSEFWIKISSEEDSLNFISLWFETELTGISSSESTKSFFRVCREFEVVSDMSLFGLFNGEIERLKFDTTDLVLFGELDFGESFNTGRYATESSAQAFW